MHGQNHIKITQSIRDTRVRWLGQLSRTDELYPCRTPTFRDSDVTRKEGRPTIRWMDTTEEGLRRKVVSNWETKAANRME